METPMSEYGEGEYKVDGEKAQEYLERERLITNAVNRCIERWKGFLEHKYEIYYYTGSELHELWESLRWKSRIQLCNEFYACIPEEYRNDFTPSILKNCLLFYEYVERKEEIWIKLINLHHLYKAKEEGKLCYSRQFTIEGWLGKEVKNIEQEIVEIFNAIRKVYPDYMKIEIEDIVRDLEPIRDLLSGSLKSILGYRVLWEMWQVRVPDHRLIEAVRIGSAYKGKKTLETLRREYRRLGTRKPKRLPPIFCHLCGAQLDFDDKNIVWIHVPVELRCLKEYLIKATTEGIDMTIEDEEILELLLKDLISKYNIEEVIEEEE